MDRSNKEEKRLGILDCLSASGRDGEALDEYCENECRDYNICLEVIKLINKEINGL